MSKGEQILYWPSDCVWSDKGQQTNNQVGLDHIPQTVCFLWYVDCNTTKLKPNITGFVLNHVYMA